MTQTVLHLQWFALHCDAGSDLQGGGRGHGERIPFSFFFFDFNQCDWDHLNLPHQKSTMILRRDSLAQFTALESLLSCGKREAGWGYYQCDQGFCCFLLLFNWRNRWYRRAACLLERTPGLGWSWQGIHHQTLSLSWFTIIISVMIIIIWILSYLQGQ